ncbi:hybrid sensor histidine kinase/response regulator [Herminiimonas arsenitoxidans]|uniref:hybrid sensor histidine kinase/response regulator n=1 Tax=Herminiimonas arsenitoxidans TaxID=1809410 RepID=UPI000970A730|nr:hybrid sensor histidine kinase/response regulator [Herminiimonas arsenitoxidans]
MTSFDQGSASPARKNKVVATLKKFSEITLLGRYQRSVLWGGGVVLTLALLAASALAVWTNIQNYIADGRSVYLTNKTLLLLEIETKQAAMRRGVINAEMIWRTPFMPASKLIDEFEKNHGRLVVQASDKVNAQLVFGAISPSHPAQSFAEMLSFTEAQAYTVTASAQQRGRPFSGYFLDVEHNFLSIMPPPKTGDPFATMKVSDTRELIDKVAPNIGNLQDTERLNFLRTTRAITWLPAAYDPFTGEEVYKLVQPAFDGEKPFVIFVSDLPSRILLKRLHEDPYDGNFMIIDRQGNLVLNTWYKKPTDPGLTQKVLESRAWEANLDSSDYSYRDGTFTISEPLSDTGWILAYAYSWRTILAAQGPFIMAYAGGTLLLLALLWFLIFFFDRKIFTPILQRSERVFESEKAARAAADAANHAKSAFLAVMSHEIRTPLNGILGNLELLARTSLTERQQDRLNIVNSSSHALLEIINDILDFSKVEAGQMTLETIRFDLLDVVEQTLAIFIPLADAKDIHLFYVIPPTLPRYYDGDPTRIRQILVNLLSNAIKFTEQGQIKIEVSAQDGMLHIAVSDTGIGISTARQTELFQPFTQAEVSTTRLFGGTGLGLALCKRLTDLMQGTITIDSRPGSGSRFTVSLPLAVNQDLSVQDIVLPQTEVVLLCPRPEWQSLIVPHLQAWGIKTRLITDPKEFPAATMPLILFGSPRMWGLADEDRIRAQASWVIDALEDGPRSPVIEEHRTIVSCYALDSLRKALELALLPQEFTSKEEPTILSQQQAQENVRVLVVEDHPVNLALIRDQLEMLGYSMSLAQQASDGLKLFAENTYDIVLTDLGMPGMDGYTFAMALRSQGATLPIIAITAHASRDEYQRCKDAGINDILLKPMSLDEIERTVRKYLFLQSATAEPRNVDAKPLSEELRKALQDSSQASLAMMQDAIASHDAVTVSEQLHSIKGAFAMQRQQHIVDACAELEAKAKADDLASIHTALPLLEKLIRQALQKIA